MKRKQVNEIRAFNRFYTSIIGLLDKYILNSQFTLPEARVLFELYNNKNITASDITSCLHMDKGYLSRMLKQFEKKNLIAKVRSENDKRITYLRLTQLGEIEAEILNQTSHNQMAGILSRLSTDECDQLIENMNSIRTILSKIKD